MKIIMIGVFLIAITCSLIYAYSDELKDSKCLSEYRTEKCLHALLSSVVLSNSKFYDPAKYYYSLEFHITGERRSLYIAPEMWNNARTLEYSGFINVRGMLFLCTGDFKEDSSFFYKTSVVKTMMLKLAENEIGLLQSFHEPSLEGTLKICKGVPIDLSIYTRGKISGYSTK